MPSKIRNTTAAGAETNNINVINIHMGRARLRNSTTTRAVLSRTQLNDVDKIDSFTLATS